MRAAARIGPGGLGTRRLKTFFREYKLKTSGIFIRFITVSTGCALALTACGLETATTAAAVAGAKAQEVQQARQQMEVMQAQIQSAGDAAQSQRKAIPD